MALMLTLVLPNLGGSLADATERATAAQLRIALQDASAEAIAQGHTVVFRADAGGYWLDARHTSLVSARTTTRLRVIVTGSGEIAFYPWGGSSGGRLRIDGPHGQSGIMVDAVTGRAVPLR